MRKRIGTKIYDTETAVLIDTLPDGIQVYKKKNSPQFFLYNPNGDDKHEMFFELPPEDAERYLHQPDEASTKVKGSTKMVQFAPAEVIRLKNLAYKLGMTVREFLLMLVDEYEQRNQ